MTSRNPWVAAFQSAYSLSPSWAELSALVSTKAGVAVSEPWLQANVDAAFAHVMLYAKCRYRVWLDPSYLPPLTAAVLGAILARVSSNPQGVRTLQTGEFSQTWASVSPGELVQSDESKIIELESGCPSTSLYTLRTSPTRGLGRTPDVGQEERQRELERSTGRVY